MRGILDKPPDGMKLGKETGAPTLYQSPERCLFSFVRIFALPNREESGLCSKMNERRLVGKSMTRDAEECSHTAETDETEEGPHDVRRQENTDSSHT